MTELTTICEKLNQFLSFELKIKINKPEISQVIKKSSRNFEGQFKIFSFYYDIFIENILAKTSQIENLVFTFFSEQNLKSFKINIVESKIIGTYANLMFFIEIKISENPTKSLQKFKFISKN